MNVLKATKRTSASTGQVNKLRSDGFIPAVLYGGKKNNLNISLKKLHLQNIINSETFMSKVYDLDIFLHGTNTEDLTVTEISVHKEDGTARYGWKEKNGIWSKKYN